jgi:hypothetical protein
MVTDDPSKVIVVFTPSTITGRHFTYEAFSRF